MAEKKKKGKEKSEKTDTKKEEKKAKEKQSDFRENSPGNLSVWAIYLIISVRYFICEVCNFS